MKLIAKRLYINIFYVLLSDFIIKKQKLKPNKAYSYTIIDKIYASAKNISTGQTALELKI